MANPATGTSAGYGGGATDIRVNGSTLSDRVLVAGGEEEQDIMVHGQVVKLLDLQEMVE